MNNTIHDLLSAVGSPYANAQDCVDKCYGVEFSDVYAATLLLNKLVNFIDEDSSNDAELLCELFHIFLALIYQQGLGNSCLYIDDIAGKTLWLAPDASNRKDAFTFTHLAQIQTYLENVSTGLDKLEAIELAWPRLYTRRFYHYEKVLCDAVFSRVGHSSLGKNMSADADVNASANDTEAFEQTLQAQWPLVFGNETDILSSQALAVLNTLTSTFSIITGAAGTGKTYSVARLLYLAFSCLSVPPSNMLLLAPTGKAANRLQESISAELMRVKPVNDMPLFYQDLLLLQPLTLHRVLKINPNNGQAKYNLHNKLTAKLVVIDEASMVDLSLMCKLILALPTDCRIVLIGDPNQLPSVEAGCILADIVRYAGTTLSKRKLSTYYSLLGMQLPNDVHDRVFHSEPLPSELASKNICVGLTQGMRSVDGINKVASAVLSGNVDKLIAMSENANTYARPPWSFVELDDSNDGKHIYLTGFVEKYVQNTLAPHFRHVAEQFSMHEAWNALRNFVCLSAFRVGAFGTEKLNQHVAKQLNFSVPSQSGFLKGQAIMIEKNDYALQLFNGDLGIVWPDEKGQFWAWFPNGVSSDARCHPLMFRQFSLYTLPQNSAAYALTIHKTQGSEYEMVDILLPEMQEKLVTRQLLYTAITRAKSSVSLYSSNRILGQTLQNDIKRSSGLGAMFAMREESMSES